MHLYNFETTISSERTLKGHMLVCLQNDEPIPHFREDTYTGITEFLRSQRCVGFLWPSMKEGEANHVHYLSGIHRINSPLFEVQARVRVHKLHWFKVSKSDLAHRSIRGLAYG